MTKQTSAAAIATADVARVEGTARPLTGAIIAAQIIEGIEALGGAFYEAENRLVADNGKTYRPDTTLPEGVEDTGSVITANRFGFLQRQLVGTVVWKLETLLKQADERIVEQRKRIGQTVRLVDTGRVDAHTVDRMADFLETLIEQRAMVQVAFDAAKEAHLVTVGDEFETAAMRADRQAQLKDKPKSPLAERLARLGC